MDKINTKTFYDISKLHSKNDSYLLFNVFEYCFLFYQLLVLKNI